MKANAFRGKSPRSQRARVGWLAARTATLALALLAGQAVGQQEQPKPPIDINQIRPQPVTPPPTPAPSPQPGTPPAPTPGAPATAATPAAAQPAGGPSEEDRRTGAYPVSRFTFRYNSVHEDHPRIEDLMGSRVTLGVTPEGFVGSTVQDANAQSETRTDIPTVTISVGDVVEGSGGKFFRSGINEVAGGVVRELNRRGIIGVFVQVDPDDVDENGVDRREGKRSEMRLIIWTGRVQDVRTIASGDRIKTAETESTVNTDDRVLKRIRDHSPVQKGDLLRREDMDGFVFRLNRHPGRRVDVAIAAGDNPEEVVVDYLVAESKPWSAYAQLSNTGTKATTEWRERFGFVHDQLTGHDDVLHLDYVTGNFDQSNDVTGSYEFPLLSDRIHTRIYGAYDQFDASEVGFAGETFSGQTYSAGGEVSGTVYQHRELFLDAIGGFRWENIRSENVGTVGQTNFGLPYLGARLERNTDAMSTMAALTIEWQVPELVGTDQAEVDKLGRPDADDHWEVLRWDVEHSMYLEPLMDPQGYKGNRSDSGAHLANEVALNFRGQYAFSNRLIANEEMVAGGMFSVRGYPESSVAGDNAVIGGAEYRFHVPRVFPFSDPGKVGNRDVRWLGSDFRWAPQQPYGRADWDFILKAFIDAAGTRVNHPQTGESNHSLVGAGVGMELEVKRNVSLRLDLGFALKDLKAEDNTETKAGDARLHFSFTLLY